MSQIFKTNFSKDIVYEFLKDYCDKTNNFYIFSKTTFKKIKLKYRNNSERYFFT